MTIDHHIAKTLGEALDEHCAQVRFQADCAYHDLAAQCESPIERLLLASLLFIRPQCLAPRSDTAGDFEREARLFPQYRVGDRRLDFAYIITPLHEAWQIKLGIECDGHAFHSSVSQRANDNMRGVEIAEDGFNVLRFSGSQINADPRGCARRVADVADGIYADNIFTTVNVTGRAKGLIPAGPLMARIVKGLGGDS